MHSPCAWWGRPWASTCIDHSCSIQCTQGQYSEVHRRLCCQVTFWQCQVWELRAVFVSWTPSIMWWPSVLLTSSRKHITSAPSEKLRRFMVSIRCCCQCASALWAGHNNLCLPKIHSPAKSAPVTPNSHSEKHIWWTARLLLPSSRLWSDGRWTSPHTPASSPVGNEIHRHTLEVLFKAI